jgi:hypothetical protein
MKKSNAIVLLIIALIIIAIGAGLYLGVRSGKIKLFAAFTGWPDVTPTDPAYTEMMVVGEKGWMVGYPDGLFHPDWGADRASVVVGMIRAREDAIISAPCNMDDPTTWPFTDVSCDHWAYDYIVTAKQLGFIDGFPDDSFQPDRATTRAEEVVFVVKAKEYDLNGVSACVPGDPSTYPFLDVPCDHWAYDYIVAAKENRIIFGYPSGNFEPEQDASRRVLALLIYRAWIQAGEEITISGTIKNADTQNPIPGANVNMVEDVEGTQLSDQSDSTGAYSLRVVATAGSFSVRASATGYQSQTKGINLTEDTTLNFELLLVQVRESTISGTVKDVDTNTAISRASVVVLNYESGSQLADLTNSSGAYMLKIAATSGTFSVKASASGYKSKTSSATLSGGNATLNFRLSKIDIPEPPGEPLTGGGTVSPATTGAVLPVTLVLIGTILALFSLIYLLRSAKQA